MSLKKILRFAKSQARKLLLVDQEGRMHYNTYDLSVSFPCDPSMPLPPGLYNAALLDAGVTTPDPTPLANYPPPTTLAKPQHTGLPLPRHAVQDLLWANKASSTEEGLYYLNGVCLDKGLFVATDGHRLFKAPSGLPESIVNAIVPRAVIAFLGKIAGRTKAATLSLSAGAVEFTVGEVVIRAKQIDGNYPDYNRVIPRVGEYRAPGYKDLDGNTTPDTVFPMRKAGTFCAQIFRGRVRVVQALAGGRQAAKTSLRFKTDGSAWCTDMTRDFSEPFGFKLLDDAGFAPEGTDIGFNLGYLLSTGMESADVYLSDAKNPALFVEGDREAVIMPLRL
jgi:hypothetical protein